jgi:hypothetical protein
VETAQLLGLDMKNDPEPREISTVVFVIANENAPNLRSIWPPPDVRRGAMTAPFEGLTVRAKPRYKVLSDVAVQACLQRIVRQAGRVGEG